MAERTVRPDGYFARGIESITHRGRPSDEDLPELPDLQRLPPPDWQGQPALELLLAGHSLDRHIDAEIRPVISEPELLLPRAFAQALERAKATVNRASKRHGQPAVLARAETILEEEQALRELARTYREALYQA